MEDTTTQPQGSPAYAGSVQMVVCRVPSFGGWYIHVATMKSGHHFPSLLWVEMWETGIMFRTPAGTYRSIDLLGAGTWFQLPLEDMADACAAPNAKDQATRGA